MQKNKNLQKFGAILESHWVVVDNGVIVGNWCEDGNSYQIKVPPQLQELIVELQNSLSDRYNEITELENQLQLKVKLIEDLFK